MKTLKINSLLLFFIITATMAKAQIQNPVHWAYGLKKMQGNTYTLHIQATIDTGWHIYAQNQSPEAICVPTKINLEKQVGLTKIGILAELGKKEKFENSDVGIINLEYANKVDFVQKVKLSPNIKLIKGSIIWQACTHKMCLQEQSIDFSVPIN